MPGLKLSPLKIKRNCHLQLEFPLMFSTKWHESVDLNRGLFLSPILICLLLVAYSLRTATHWLIWYEVGLETGLPKEVAFANKLQHTSPLLHNIWRLRSWKAVVALISGVVLMVALTSLCFKKRITREDCPSNQSPGLDAADPVFETVFLAQSHLKVALPPPPTPRIGRCLTSRNGTVYLHPLQLILQLILTCASRKILDY